MKLGVTRSAPPIISWKHSDGFRFTAQLTLGHNVGVALVMASMARLLLALGWSHWSQAMHIVTSG